MDRERKILECIPNFSEGANNATIAAIAEAIASVDGQKLLHIDRGPSANRTVMTFAGDPEAVVEAAFRAIKAAAEHINMTLQHGEHPRIGATDVCPLVPLQGMDMKEAVYWSEMLARRVAAELDIPVYLYEFNAVKDYRRALPDIRKGQYEGIFAKMRHPDWQPDYGCLTATNEAQVHKTGATIIGARRVLVAFNISLDTEDEAVATQIAKKLRSSGYFTKDAQGNRQHVPGLLPALRAIGWYMAEFKTAQVSMNLLDYRLTSPLAAWQQCSEVAAGFGVHLLGCELVGLIPLSCITEAGAFVLNSSTAAEDELVKAGIQYLGLDKVKPFAAREKILEYALEDIMGVLLRL